MTRQHIIGLLFGVVVLCGCQSQEKPNIVQPPEHVDVASTSEQTHTNTQKEPPASVAVPPDMVLVPGGEFFMGIPEEENIATQKGKLTSTPAFLIERVEVSVEQYLKCRSAGPCKEPLKDDDDCNAVAEPPRPDHPMNCVSWREAGTFCAWQGRRLPSSAEWELAARGTDKRPYPWGSEVPDEQLCWQGPKGKGKIKRTTCPVGSFPQGASPYGVLDMAGNVAEWTSTANTSRGANYTYYGKRGGSYAFDRDDAAAFKHDPIWSKVRVDLDDTTDGVNRFPTLGWRCAADSR